jgi:hypothetical protein
METANTYTAFEGHRLLSQGPLEHVVLRVKRRLGKAENSSILIFSDLTGKSMDFNFQGSEKEVLKRLEVYISGDEVKEPVGPGRPKLGVISREVSLLPRHWEWLATQAGGASATLRRLVEDAKKKSETGQDIKQSQERTYKFMSVLAGDQIGYEEALRALYKKDKKKFVGLIQEWPSDVRTYAMELAKPVFEG